MQALHLGLYVGLAFIAGYVATNAATLPGISAAAARAKRMRGPQCMGQAMAATAAFDLQSMTASIE